MEINYCDPMALTTLLRLRRERGERRIGWRALGVGMVIANFADKKTGEAWPSRATLAAITGIEEADVSRVVHELKEAGFLTIEEREGRSNIYRLTHVDLATGGKLPPSGKQPPTHVDLATGGKLPPPGKQPPTHVDLATKPVCVQPPITITEQPKNNVFPQHTLFSEKPEPEKPTSEPGDEPATPLKEPTTAKGKTSPKTPSKPKAKKEYPGDLAADAGKLVALYAKLVKPKKMDNSGSISTFSDTAKRLLSNGTPYADLELAARNYAAVRKMEERKENNPDDQIKFRHGFQTFYGVKFQHWKDYLGETLEAAPDQPARGRHPESTGEAQRMMQFFKKGD